ncbi:MAG: hypothetical protein JSW60_08655 [Thermoplasmatales archaeon]|nr:MAG: hypothetical protein JSW60_08655 [Thermoplasmatales archaeon]
MKKSNNKKIRLVLTIAVCTLFVTVAFSGVVAKDPKDKPELDWDYWSNPPHMFSNVTGNVGIGTTNPSEKLEVDGNVKATSYYGDGSSLTGVVKTELDPVFGSSAASGIFASDITNWNAAYGWGDHSVADAVLQANIDAEETARIAADNALQAAIDTEVAARTAADDALQTDIDDEEATRIVNDTILQSNISTLAAEDASDYDSLEDLETAVADGFNIATSSGKVGIGTLNPATKFQVIGTTMLNGGTAIVGATAITGVTGIIGDTKIIGATLVIGPFLVIGSKLFVIDYPLDPLNKSMYHASIESSEMKTLYDGIVELDENGEALVELPEWFEALNKDFRYQLSCIGGYAPVYIAEEISDNQFKIAGGNPGLNVSWQVTGIRHDPYAEYYDFEVVEEKPDDEKGTYLNPAVYE